MPKFNSGKKVINNIIDKLVKELDSLKQAVSAYNVVQNYSYGGCLEALNNSCANGNTLQPTFVKDDGSHIARPLSFEETIDAIVNAYESGNHKLLYNRNDTCTGIASKLGTEKFKIVPISKDLILLNKNFSQPSILIDYDSLEGIPLYRSKGKYNSLLTESEVLINQGLCEAVTDKLLLSTFRDIVFAERKTETAMGLFLSEKLFSIKKGQEQDQLRPLAVNYFNFGSFAYDSDSLINYNYAQFIRVSKK